MILADVVHKPTILNERNVHPLERCWKVHIAYRLHVVENCSEIIDVIFLNIIGFLVEVSIVEQQISALNNLLSVF